MFPLYADNDSGTESIVGALRRAGVDIVRTADVRNRSLSDDDQLAYAVRTGRVMFTGNVHDFPRIHKAIVGSGDSHSGIIVNPDQLMRPGSQIRALLRLQEVFDSQALVNQLLYLTNWVPS
jgi:hypothetical protein